jgi:hypothetical protein
MSIFTRKNNTYPEVPAHLAEAYEAAEPNPVQYMEQAASQLVPELLTINGLSTPEDRHRIYTDYFPQLMARAEHLSRIMAARWAVEMRQRMDAMKADGERRNTCKVCGEANGHLQHYMNAELTAGSGLYSQPQMCTPCRYTADLLYAQATTTPARQAAVRAALNIPKPRA